MKEAVQGIEHPEPAETLVLRSLALCDADPLRRRYSYSPFFPLLKAVPLVVLGLLAIITLGWTSRVMAGISLGEPITMEQMTALAYVFQNIVMVSLMPLLLRRRKKAPAPLRDRSSGTAGMALMI